MLPGHKKDVCLRVETKVSYNVNDYFCYACNLLTDTASARTHLAHSAAFVTTGTPLLAPIPSPGALMTTSAPCTFITATRKRIAGTQTAPTSAHAERGSLAMDLSVRYTSECNFCSTMLHELSQDINECLTDNGGCSPHAACHNIPGSRRCVCDRGYDGDGVSCADIDECAEDPALCANGVCLNRLGSFVCECQMGYMHPDPDDQTACVDVDECAAHDVCKNGVCENVDGFFRYVSLKVPCE